MELLSQKVLQSYNCDDEAYKCANRPDANPFDWEMYRVRQRKMEELIQKFSYRITDTIKVLSNPNAKEDVISVITTLIFRLRTLLMRKEIAWDEVINSQEIPVGTEEELGVLMQKFSKQALDTLRVFLDSSSSCEVIIPVIQSFLLSLQRVLTPRLNSFAEVEQELKKRSENRFFMYSD